MVLGRIVRGKSSSGWLRLTANAHQPRNAFQIAFAPSIFFDSVPKKRLTPGDTRVHTNLNLQISFSEETILRMPTREASKVCGRNWQSANGQDWIYDGVKGKPERRYGWLEVAAGPNSSITYTQSQFATEHGYDTMLILHLDSLRLSSSVNLDTFIQSKSCKVSNEVEILLRPVAVDDNAHAASLGRSTQLGFRHCARWARRYASSRPLHLDIGSRSRLELRRHRRFPSFRTQPLQFSRNTHQLRHPSLCERLQHHRRAKITGRKWLVRWYQFRTDSFSICRSVR